MKSTFSRRISHGRAPWDISLWWVARSAAVAASSAPFTARSAHSYSQRRSTTANEGGERRIHCCQRCGRSNLGTVGGSLIDWFHLALRESSHRSCIQKGRDRSIPQGFCWKSGTHSSVIDPLPEWSTVFYRTLSSDIEANRFLEDDDRRDSGEETARKGWGREWKREEGHSSLQGIESHQSEWNNGDIWSNQERKPVWLRRWEDISMDKERRFYDINSGHEIQSQFDRYIQCEMNLIENLDPVQHTISVITSRLPDIIRVWEVHRSTHISWMAILGLSFLSLLGTDRRVNEGDEEATAGMFSIWDIFFFIWDIIISINTRLPYLNPSTVISDDIRMLARCQYLHLVKNLHNTSFVTLFSYVSLRYP